MHLNLHAVYSLSYSWNSLPLTPENIFRKSCYWCALYLSDGIDDLLVVILTVDHSFFFQGAKVSHDLSFHPFQWETEWGGGGGGGGGEGINQLTFESAIASQHLCSITTTV